MPEPVFVITETFFIKGRGLVLLYTEVRQANPPVRVRLGDEVELTSPSGEKQRTRVTGVEIADFCQPRLRPALGGILVSLTAEDGVRLRGARVRVIT
jgi:hypothetical protein